MLTFINTIMIMIILVRIMISIIMIILVRIMVSIIMIIIINIIMTMITRMGYEAVCGGEFTSPSGVVASPYHPLSYPRSDH